LLLDPRVVDPNLGRTGLALVGEPQERQRGAIEIVRALFLDVVGRDVRIEQPGEPFGQFRPTGFQALVDPLRDAVDELLLVLLGPVCHGLPPVVRASAESQGRLTHSNEDGECSLRGAPCHNLRIPERPSTTAAVSPGAESLYCLGSKHLEKLEVPRWQECLPWMPP
jgi:hypothetical protein